MSKIDWDAKLEVSTEGGMVYPATLLDRKSLEVFWHAGFKDYVHCFYENGLPHPGLHHTTVRNVTEPKADIEGWAIKRAEELSGCNFYGDFGGVGGAFARYVMTKEEAPVDPDEAVADELLRLDATTRVIILRAIKRGRELERGEVK